MKHLIKFVCFVPMRLGTGLMMIVIRRDVLLGMAQIVLPSVLMIFVSRSNDLVNEGSCQVLLTNNGRLYGPLESVVVVADGFHKGVEIPVNRVTLYEGTPVC